MPAGIPSILNKLLKYLLTYGEIIEKFDAHIPPILLSTIVYIFRPLFDNLEKKYVKFYFQR